MYRIGNENHQLGRGPFVQHRIVSAVQRVKYICDKISYTLLQVHWCNTVFKAHAPSEETSDDSKDSFYKELEKLFDHFPKHHMEILLGKFDAKIGDREHEVRANMNYNLFVVQKHSAVH